MNLDMRESMVMPFHDIFPKVMKNPNGKRLPMPGRDRHSRGLSNIEVFCMRWRRMCEEFPGLVTSSDCIAFDPAFELMWSIEEGMEATK